MAGIYGMKQKATIVPGKSNIAMADNHWIIFHQAVVCRI
jgi:hypothetical protein